MSCKKYEKFLYLYRDGELEEDEILQLHRHLADCEGCRAFFETLQQQPLHTFVRTRMDEICPEVSLNPAEIFNTVQAQKKKPLKQRIDILLEMVRNGLIRPRVQMAWAGLTLLFIITLVGQQLHFASKLTRLEQQMAVVSQNQISRELSNFIPADFLKDSMLDSQSIQRLIVHYESEMKSSSSITLDGEELKTLILIYQKLKVQNRMLAGTLQAVFPEIENYQGRTNAIQRVIIHKNQIEALARAL